MLPAWVTDEGDYDEGESVGLSVRNEDGSRGPRPPRAGMRLMSNCPVEFGRAYAGMMISMYPHSLAPSLRRRHRGVVAWIGDDRIEVRWERPPSWEQPPGDLPYISFLTTSKIKIWHNRGERSRPRKSRNEVVKNDLYDLPRETSEGKDWWNGGGEPEDYGLDFRTKQEFFDRYGCVGDKCREWDMAPSSHPGASDVFFRCHKGTHEDADSYSAFFDDYHKHEVKGGNASLHEWLQHPDRNVKNLYIAGLFFDTAVQNSNSPRKLAPGLSKN
eukprot:gene17716-biopygen2142